MKRHNKFVRFRNKENRYSRNTRARSRKRIGRRIRRRFGRIRLKDWSEGQRTQLSAWSDFFRSLGDSDHRLTYLESLELFQVIDGRIVPEPDFHPDPSTRMLQGYGYVRNPISGDWISEHHVSIQKVLKRPVRVGYQVHHIDRDMLNNRPCNLMELSRLEHMEVHEFMRVAEPLGVTFGPLVTCCSKCKCYDPGIF